MLGYFLHLRSSFILRCSMLSINGSNSAYFEILRLLTTFTKKLLRSSAVSNSVWQFHFFQSKVFCPLSLDGYVYIKHMYIQYLLLYIYMLYKYTFIYKYMHKLQRRWSKEDANMVFSAINMYTTAAKRVRKYQKSIMVKLYYTAKS